MSVAGGFSNLLENPIWVIFWSTQSLNETNTNWHIQVARTHLSFEIHVLNDRSNDIWRMNEVCLLGWRSPAGMSNRSIDSFVAAIHRRTIELFDQHLQCLNVMNRILL